jgi:uncharacterized protein
VEFFGLSSVPYLHSVGLKKNVSIKSLGLIFSIDTVCLSLKLPQDSKISIEIAIDCLTQLAPAIAGKSAGAWLRKQVREEAQRYFIAALLILGVYMTCQAMETR